MENKNKQTAFSNYHEEPKYSSKKKHSNAMSTEFGTDMYEEMLNEKMNVHVKSNTADATNQNQNNK